MLCLNTQRLIERFFRYVRCSSESGNEKEFCLLIEDELRLLGFDIYRDEVGSKCGSNGWNIIAGLEGNGEPLLLSAHLDTVTPGVNIKPELKDGVIYSDGTTILGADDKAAIAAVLEAVEMIIEEDRPHNSVEVLFSICEELGLLGAKYADYKLIKSKAALVLDNERIGEIINRNPANIKVYFTVRGRSAHAGMAPEQGIHALKAAAQAVNSIKVGRVDDITVMNISNFLSPGKTNIVADTASFDMEIRSFSEETAQKHIKAAEKAVKEACKDYGATYEMRVERCSYVINVPDDSSLIDMVREAFKKAGRECFIAESFGGCDATHIFANGIEVVNLGVGMSDVHSCSEHIAVKDLETITEVIYHILTR